MAAQPIPPAGEMHFRLAEAPQCAATCFEPTVAVTRAGWLAVASSNDGIAVSADGGRTFELHPSPPIPSSTLPALLEPVLGRGDEMVQAGGDGRVFYTSIVLPSLVQVAVSDDGARTWEVNQLLAPPLLPTESVDRQWLAFGPSDEVYVSVNKVLGEGTRTNVIVARSDDGGRTFGPFRDVDPSPARLAGANGGRAAVAADGTLYVPYFEYPREGGLPATRLKVARSVDGGATFQGLTVFDADAGITGGFFPALAAEKGGRLVVAWNRGEEILLAASEDAGNSWWEPEVWSQPGEQAEVAPWLEPGADGGVHLLYFHKIGDGVAELVLVSAGPGHADSQAAPRWVVAPEVHGTRGAGGRASNTDMAFMAIGPGELPVIVWSDTLTGVATLAFVERASGAS